MLPLVCSLLLTAPTLDVQGTAFTFRAGFWNNLHHFLYVQGRAKNGEPDRTRDAVVKAPLDVDGLGARSDAERAAWNAAIAFYAAGPSKKDTVFDADLVKLTRTLASLPDEGDPVTAGIDPALAATLKRVAPIYRAVWWTRHSQANASRRTELQAMLDMYGSRAVARLTSVYHTTWPAKPRTIDLAAYANWAGAYSTDGGLIVFSSTDEALGGADGLETLLHESSHQWDKEINDRIYRVAGEKHVEVPDGLSHMLIFYTSGVITSDVIPDHIPYAVHYGVWNRGNFRGMKEVFDKYWLPYLRGTGTFEQAIAALLTR